MYIYIYIYIHTQLSPMQQGVQSVPLPTHVCTWIIVHGIQVLLLLALYVYIYIYIYMYVCIMTCRF